MLMPDTDVSPDEPRSGSLSSNVARASRAAPAHEIPAGVQASDVSPARVVEKASHHEDASGHEASVRTILARFASSLTRPSDTLGVRHPSFLLKIGPSRTSTAQSSRRRTPSTSRDRADDPSVTKYGGVENVELVRGRGRSGSTRKLRKRTPDGTETYRPFH